ncbi:MAG: DnaA/Hda family protein [Planctomycetaceae bacterium]
MTRGPEVCGARTDAQFPFLVLPESQLAFAAATQLRETRSARLYPLLTISGPAGSGKTHLLTQVFAIRRPAAEQTRLLEITAEEFVEEWNEAVRSRRVVEMRELYLAHQVLVCEDLQGFAAATAAQDAFVTLLDELIASGGRAIVTCNSEPRTIRGLTARLVNRCHGGTSAAISLPGRASRLKLLRHFAAPLQVPVPLDALELLATPEGRSPRELRGELRRLVQAAEQRRRPVDVALLKDIQAGEPAEKGRQVADVAREVARQFGITLRQLRSESRATATRVPRQAAMFLSRQITAAPCAEIGAYFSGRTHSTVVYACERFEQQIAEDPRLMARLEKVRQALARPTSRWRRKPVDRRRSKRRATG